MVPRISLALIVVFLLNLSFLFSLSPVDLVQGMDSVPNFTMTIVASINNYSSTCTFGIDQNAGTTYTSNYDPLAQNFPSTGIHAWLFNFNTSYKSGEQKLKTLIVPSNGSTTWHLKVINIDQVGTVTVSWDKTNFASMTLRGHIFQDKLADMNKVSNYSYTVDSWAQVAELDIVYNWAGLTTPTPPPPQPPSNSAPATEWQNGYGNDRSGDNRTEYVSNLIQTSDGGYAFMDLGWMHGFTLQPATVYKVDSTGKIQWQKTIAYFIGKSIVQTNDHGYELIGEWNTYGTTYKETPALLKTDPDGNIEWYVNYTSSPDFTVSYSQIQTSDGGFAYVSTSGSLVKADSNNQTQWTKEFTVHNPLYRAEEGYYHPILFSLTETSDGAIAILGVANPDYGINVWGNVYLAKTEPFLPLPLPTVLPTPIPTTRPTPNQEPFNSFTVIVPIVIAVLLIIAFLSLLYLRRQKAALVKKP